MSICVAVGNKVMDTRLPQPAGCGDKYDVYGWCWERMFSAFCMFFKSSSPDAKASPSPARGEGYRLHRPWCHKILGTDCASRPSMTGARGANFFGRSMIEMLGVLAIISVLSVGGIAGYSKAMRMWHSNMQKDLLVQLLARSINIRSDLAPMKNTTMQNITYLFETLGDIPSGITYENNVLKDKDGNLLRISYGVNSWRGSDGKTYSRSEYIMRLDLLHNASMYHLGAEDFCVNAVTVTQQYRESIEKVVLYRNNFSAAEVWNSAALKEKTLSDVQNYCHTCNFAGYCYLSIYITP